jgi:hypothetical protein
MTDKELELERQYLIDERLGMICGSNPPSKQDERLATEAADREIERLKRGQLDCQDGRESL